MLSELVSAMGTEHNQGDSRGQTLCCLFCIARISLSLNLWHRLYDGH